MDKLSIPRQCVKEIDDLVAEYEGIPGSDHEFVARAYRILKPYVDYMIDVVLLKKYDSRHTRFFLDSMSIINSHVVIDDDEIAKLVRKTEQYHSLKSIHADVYSSAFCYTMIAYRRFYDKKTHFSAFFVKRMWLGLRDYFRRQYFYFEKISKETELIDASYEDSIDDYYKEDVSGLFDYDNPYYRTFTRMDRYLVFMRLYQGLSWREIRKHLNVSFRFLRRQKEALTERFKKLII